MKQKIILPVWQPYGTDALQSCEPVTIPFLGLAVNVLVDLEEEHLQLTIHQEQTLLAFLNLSQDAAIKLKDAWLNYYQAQLHKRRIVACPQQKIIHWQLEDSFITVPRQGAAKDRYIMLYPATQWVLQNSIDQEITLEVELLYKNEQLLLIQEMTGLSYRGDAHLDY